MSDESNIPRTAVTAVDSFVAAHGATTAVIQGVSMDQVRITLVGSDGALGDVMVRDSATAELVVTASQAEPGEWDRELSGAVKLGPVHRERMARGQGS